MVRRAGVLTVSDRAAAGERSDTAGPVVVRLLTDAGYEVVAQAVLSDDPAAISEQLIAWAEEDLALVVTTGGTGVAPRDRTPQATEAVLDYLVPGIPEAMRAAFVPSLPTAMLSRGVAGVRGRTLIVNLPGSERAARECLQVVLPALGHACDLLAEAIAAVEGAHGVLQGGPDSRETGA